MAGRKPKISLFEVSEIKMKSDDVTEEKRCDKVQNKPEEKRDENKQHLQNKCTGTKLCKEFVKKYFLEGQNLNHQTSENNNNNVSVWRQIVTSRRFCGIMIPFIFFQVCWWSLAIKHNFFKYFPDKYVMSLTMTAGAMIAGMTSEGGGSVAFPVMTLALKISPVVARDFSLMIQSCGMTAAAFTIYWMKIKVEKHSLFFCSIGAIFGMVFGLEVLDAALHPAIKKLGFVSIWFSFAFALFLLNRQRKRPTFDSIRDCGIWQAVVLIITGFAGGIFSALSGSGVDICSFSVLCLLFRVSEKVATPTSVVLMAINTCVGFFWRELMTSQGAAKEAWEYMAVCVPIVVFCAPLGSMVASHFHRLVLASFVYITDTVALVTALCVIPMYPNGNPTRIIVVVSLVVGGFSFFGLMSYLGGKYCERVTRGDEEVTSDAVGHDYTNKMSFTEEEEKEVGRISSESSSNGSSNSPPGRPRRVSHHYY